MKTLERFGAEFQHKVLNNGVNLFLFERKGMPIHLRASFYAGSRFDTIPGTAHFLEHMLLAGTRKFPTKNLIADYLQKVGGDFSASTDADFLRLYVEIPLKEDIQFGLEVVEECLSYPLFDHKTIESERGAILSELRSKKSNPKEFVWDVSRKLSMQGTALANTNLGTEESVNSIDLDSVAEFYKAYINTGRLVFVASGDINIEELAAGLNHIKLPVGDKFLIPSPLPIIREVNTLVEVYPKLTQLQVFLTIRLSIDSYEEFCALQVLNNVLTIGRGSRLMTRLRYENGLVYSVNGSMTTVKDWGVMRFQLSCDKDNFEKVKELIFKEFDNLKINSISATELENAKSRVSKGSIREMQTSQSWVGRHEGMSMFYSKDFKTIGDYIDVVDKLSSEDISKVANKYLSPDQVYIAICGDV